MSRHSQRRTGFSHFHLFVCGVFLSAQLAAGATNTSPPSVTFEDINEVFGVELLAGDSLWDEDDEAAATRVKLPQESRTSTQASFRRYPGENIKILGVRPYSFAMYSENGKPMHISIIFSNKGDYPPFAEAAEKITGSGFDRDTYLKSCESQFNKTLRTEKRTISEALTKLIGKPSHKKFGQGHNMAEWVDWWSWNKHVFLLSMTEGEYVGLRIMPEEQAEARGKGLRKTSDAELKAILAKRVERRANGDVVVTDIPMVNQGGKGYCVPATWERYLRYMDIPADMYVLAMAGKTGKGGGTTIEAITDGATALVSRSGRRIQTIKSTISIKNISNNIDQGLPMMWSIHMTPALNDEVTQRAIERSSIADMQTWNEFLKPIRRKAHRNSSSDNAHMTMIMGYNPTTKEIAISDSWGRGYEERWLTVEEADAISFGTLMVIKW